MASQQIPRYHVAPNFSIPPVEAGGILELGAIIASVADADEPINEDCHVSIPISKLLCSHQKGFSATKSSMTTGEYGIWAKVVGVDGFGCELSWAPERSAEDIYHFRGIDTIYFNPSQEYMEESMSKVDVKDFIVGSGYGPVFMVTGLKTARGPSVKMSKSKKWTNTVELGLQEPGGIPIELGPKFDTSKETRQEMGFEDSTDFIIGIRVKKLMYKKHWRQWLTRIPGKLVAKQHNKGATMVDDDVVEKGYDEVVDLGDDSEGEDPEGQIQVETEEVGSETLQTAWVCGKN
ncbi:hypothetical protein CKAH01_17741 [Colletotrichum kahawae]|uniref:Uncharacterized protein n=1 Tax=Colletotrichum kahawae TaxID=34407 RepID=A0AAD9Y8F8_COLKA|nr:hypothetical protein CKAH01_17741 [Colletotrichum kahawae]